MGQVFLPSLDRMVSGTDQFPMPPCTKVDPEIFTQHRYRKRAKQVCMACPLRDACRVKIMHEETDPGGVYAALTEDERNDIRSRITCPAPIDH
jgi:hypothetical protein